MNKISFFIILILLSISAKSQEDCRMDVKIGDSYKDLGDILNCMSKKINRLEEEIKKLKSPATVIINDNNKCGPERAEKFIASLITTLSSSIINAKFSIRNTTSEPLFLAADKNLPATLNADKISSDVVLREDPQGISVYAISFGGVDKEQAYTRIGPGQTHSVKLAFSLKNATGESGDTRVTVTMNFLNLDNGNVRRVAASPCALMSVGN